LLVTICNSRLVSFSKVGAISFVYISVTSGLKFEKQTSLITFVLFSSLVKIEVLNGKTVVSNNNFFL